MAASEERAHVWLGEWRSIPAIAEPTGPCVAEEVGHTAWFHCFAGIAGDMALGALLDAGADLDEVRALLRRLPVGGWSLDTEPALRGGIAGTRAVVGTDEDGTSRTAADIAAIVTAAALPPRVTKRALATFTLLAEVEAGLHRRAVDEVHLHEVGGLDAIVDVVGVAAALEVLDVDRVTASTVTTGTGTIRAAHGVLPNPAPAVVGLLARAGAPVRGLDVDVELTTPTGAALLVALATSWGPLPAMAVSASGFGAGTRDLAALPNLTQVVLGSPGLGDAGAPPGQPVVLLEANVDDATGEALADAVVALLAAGAHDAWLTPIVMKKGRPAHVVSALVDVALVEPVSAVLLAATGTFGIRRSTLDRRPVPRRLEAVDVAGHAVGMKVGPHRAKVEHDDAARAAAATGMSLAEVTSLAEEAWRRREADEEA